MNKKKWSNPGIPLLTLALKLCEEAAEVGGVITDAQISNDGTPYVGTEGLLLTNKEKDHLLEELDHAEFFIKTIRKRVQ